MGTTNWSCNAFPSPGLHCSDVNQNFLLQSIHEHDLSWKCLLCRRKVQEQMMEVEKQPWDPRDGLIPGASATQSVAFMLLNLFSHVQL